jgi:plastocyanin
MLKLSSIPLAALWLAAFPVLATAETHDVAVLDNRFSPNDITILVGDTVRWTNAAGGASHDVTSDDGKFSPSETASSFTFSRTFNSVDEILYYCTVHSTPGQDRNTRMNGRVLVVEADPPPAEDPFLINAAISDAWFYPVTSGQGFFIIVWEGSKSIFLAWFTYDTERPPEDVTAILGEPGHRWLTALGPYEGDTALLDVFLSSGMIFDSDEPPVDTEQMEGATIEIVWSDCKAGILKYDIPTLGLSGEIPIKRIVEDKVAACEAAQPQ